MLKLYIKLPSQKHKNKNDVSKYTSMSNRVHLTILTVYFNAFIADYNFSLETFDCNLVSDIKGGT
jgi:hypothetical protein